ncbi:MAG: hypothetical protein GQ583_01935 [Methyloprofundus sp.]|nr:hypothetical protein [Methyloprofundus sp.]
MSKIIILIEPADGHVNPFVPIITQLIAQGHELVCITGIRFKQRLESLGARFYPLPSQWDPGEQAVYDFFPGLKNKTGLAQIKFYLKHIMYDQLPDILSELKNVLADFPADVIVCDTFMLAGNWITELGGPPSIRLSIIPLSLPGKDIAPFGLGLLPGKSILGKLKNNLLNRIFEKLIFRDVQVHVNRIRTQVGLAAFDKSFFIKGFEIPNLVLHTSTPSFEYSRHKMPDNFRFIGPILTAADADYQLPDWWADIDQNLPIILLNQGTVANNPNDLIRPTIAALKDVPVNVLIVPANPDTLKTLPQNMYAASYIPHGNILPHIDMMISNGGMGGTQNALAHGVPVIIAGATEDKMEVAARVENSGAGINLRQQSPSAANIKQAVETILHNPQYKQKARELQADYARYDAVSLAVASIEQLIKDTKKEDKID